VAVLTVHMRALLIRILQIVALYAPGSRTVRVWLHRRRGVVIGSDVFIGTDVLIETSRPELIWLGDNVTLSVRATIVGHFRGTTAAERGDPSERFSVRIDPDAFVGPNAVILPGVTVGRGAVVTAGSVVTSTVQPFTVVQGNPARPVAKCSVPLGTRTTAAEFTRGLRPLGVRGANPE
jgi:acetyltransferase-like isoleucine patch superfamily enzyme